MFCAISAVIAAGIRLLTGLARSMAPIVNWVILDIAPVGTQEVRAIELAPIRFNAIHPGIVGDSPYWKGKQLDAVLARTPTGRLATMAEVVDATVFLLENRAVNGVNLYVDGGWMLM